MGLHPDLTSEQMQRILREGQGEGAPQAEGEGAPQAPKKRKFNVNLKAEAWKHFIRGVTKEDDSYTATCKYCGIVYDMGNQKGTGSLRHHYLKSCQKKPTRKNADKKQQLLQFQNATEAGENKVAVWSFDQATCRKYLAIMVIVHEYPFNIVSHYFFRAFSLVLDNASSNDACIRELLGGAMVKVPNKKPAWDVPTRWNSTYLMLELALELRPAIERYATLDKHYTLKPKDTEWEAVEALMDCLKIFYTATLKFSAVKYPTLNYFFPEMCEVYVSIKNMDSSPYPFIVLMTTKMFAKWERYWTSGNTLLAIACVLDPRCKVAVVEYYFKLVYPGHHDFYMSNLNACINAMLAEKKTTEPVKSELEQYISEPLDDTAFEAEFDILAWWKLKVPKYPVLSRLARDILAVPASTVASESTFSTSGRTLSVVRNSLNDESIEALICAQDWLRAKVTDNGEQVGDPLWPSVEATPDDTIAGSQA
ncbi:Zinc finger BED domain-containing protein DAYSLEEPER [Rhynchospora pubera]|uniref:Zinc finger BED domain-containing protein DAYSLEEPER n=1 Tax=Rhynchospora pubera TaxID=906938 RepID=A0AAV8HLZ2_9POAL|nr:Zinc finger BED domain-containing protein DAYSLEEPER [Rhynchospora pubera]